jgi:hypothetical protein
MAAQLLGWAPQGPPYKYGGRQQAAVLPLHHLGSRCANRDFTRILASVSFFPSPPLFFGSYCIVLLVLLRSLGIANNSTNRCWAPQGPPYKYGGRQQAAVLPLHHLGSRCANRPCGAQQRSRFESWPRYLFFPPPPFFLGLTVLSCFPKKRGGEGKKDTEARIRTWIAAGPRRAPHTNMGGPCGAQQRSRFESWPRYLFFPPPPFFLGLTVLSPGFEPGSLLGPAGPPIQIWGPTTSSCAAIAPPRL